MGRKNLIGFLIVITLGHVAKAQNEDNMLRIQEGTWKLGANTGLTYSSDGGLATIGNASISYFLIDKLAIGLEFDYYTNINNNRERVLFGPSLTYYFYEFSNGELFISESVKFGYEKNEVLGQESYRNLQIAETKLGVDFRITPTLSIGPRISYQLDLDKKQSLIIPGFGLNYSF